ncbi:MAG: 16S rRNA (guanine(966)-N(2))-methyltransferase RsmD [Rubrivivax sp.]
MSRGPSTAARRTTGKVGTAARAAPHELRVIGGLWRGRKLVVPERPGLRPTPDRVRETLFNWLGQDLSGWRVLDAFAGSGALGIEAASRGASAVRLIELEPVVVAALRAARERLQAQAVLQVERGDAFAWMGAASKRGFELVLLDPPFDATGAAHAALVLALPLVVPGGWIYVEAAQPLDLLPAGLREHRRLRAGAVCAQLLQVD